MLRIPGIFEEVSIIGYKDLKKDQPYQSRGTFSVSAVTVYLLQDLNSNTTILTVDLQGMPTWRCWQLKVFEWLEKITTVIHTGDLLIHWCTGEDTPMCKEFLGLLPKPLYHNRLHVVFRHEHTAWRLYLTLQRCESHILEVWAVFAHVTIPCYSVGYKHWLSSLTASSCLTRLIALH
jgi:hypothetical protein